jgi:hypothetical protein
VKAGPVRDTDERDMDEEIRKLIEQHRRTRLQFLKAELETCFTALEIAKYELSMGNTTVAQREVAFIDKGIRALQRFLPDLPDSKEKANIKAKLAKLQASLKPVQAEVELSLR